ncbi:unnamed protein product [Fusarium graminearum]|uniref:Uncharacterized protein n=1 Tax=Gibberella zeae TaxID=5518 RepID=A0A4U9EK20_GIBZA|nr:unnamed protein product [Fusarium graminearum]CAG1989366.1 unnamed protein product [Fusarium graminearum]CAG1997728.1 unnamed protein product [Fusarium graminearum]CAG2011773.1 unnamed protein product [Fusarium graminearum]VTO83347.1 unnamed protein product [Fusarium graminearum]
MSPLRAVPSGFWSNQTLTSKAPLTLSDNLLEGKKPPRKACALIWHTLQPANARQPCKLDDLYLGDVGFIF